MVRLSLRWITLKGPFKTRVCAEVQDLKMAVHGIVGCSHIISPLGGCSHVEPCREADAATGTGGLRGCWVLCVGMRCGLCCHLRCAPAVAVWGCLCRSGSVRRRPKWAGTMWRWWPATGLCVVGR